MTVGTAEPLLPLSRAFAGSSSGAQLLESDGADRLTVLGNPQVLKALRELLQRPISSAGELREAA